MFWLKDVTLLYTGETGFVREKCARTSLDRNQLKNLRLFHLGEHLDFLNSTASAFHADYFQNIA